MTTAAKSILAPVLIGRLSRGAPWLRYMGSLPLAICLTIVALWSLQH